MATGDPPDSGGEPDAPSQRRAWPWFYGTLVLVIVLAVLGAIFLRPSSSPGQKPPRAPDPKTGEPGDHWYTAFHEFIVVQLSPEGARLYSVQRIFPEQS